MFDIFLCKTFHLPCFPLPKVNSQPPVIYIEPINDTKIDMNRFSEQSSDGFQMVLNNNGMVMTGHSKKNSDLFGTKVQKLIGKVLGDGNSRQIVTIISDIVKQVAKLQKSVGCVVTVKRGSEEKKYVMICLPIIYGDGVYSFYLSKKPIESAIEHSSSFSIMET